MIVLIAKAEWMQLRRDGRLVAVLVMTVLLGLAAALSGYASVQQLEAERALAETTDRTVWDNQGEKNPHTAAHFSRYVFQPMPTLALFDPGLGDHLGRAIWVEAHFRDPATLRAVEDKIELQRIAEFSPAWIFQVLAPLLAVLLGASAIAAERERGTLRQIMSSGVTPLGLFAGKSIAAVSVTVLLFPSLIAAFAMILLSDHALILSATPVRLGLLFLFYALYILAFIGLAIGLSSRFKRAKSALVLLAAIWAVSVLFLPRLAGDLAVKAAPAPAAATFASRLRAESGDPFWGDTEEAVNRRDGIESGLLDQYGVESADQLPINLDGYLLQASEEFANDVFDRRYGQLWDSYETHADFVRGFSVLSPRIALSNISMALSGTSLADYRHFADKAELYRRDFVKRLNEDMIQNAGPEGYGYVTDDSFWRSLPDFSYEPPTLGSALANIWVDILVLFGWFIVAVGFSLSGFSYSFRQEAMA